MQWPADRVERWPISRLTPYARNSRKHSTTQIGQIAASIKEWGWTIPILADPAGGIIAGHARVQAAEKLGIKDVPVMIAEGWSDAKKRAYVIADNRLALGSSWDEEILSIELTGLQDEGFNLELTGFTAEELRNYAPGLEGSGEGDLEPDAAEYLARMNVTIPEPRHKVEPGDRWVLGELHYLLCVGVIDQHDEWAPLLDAGSLFAPYPGPFVPFGTRATKQRIVMVQPDPWIAGHILDRYTDAHGEESVVKV